jgi:hypothetical protein
MKVIEAHAGQPINTNSPAAVIHFDHGYYWEIPANRQDALWISKIANELAGRDLNVITIVGGSIAVRTVGGKAAVLR